VGLHQKPFRITEGLVYFWRIMLVYMSIK